MCLIALAVNVHPRWPMVLAANRDEFHQRPAAPAGWWHDHPDIYGGRDLSAGGTWLGLERRGRLGAITNYRERTPEAAAPRSRGHLIRQFLSSADSSEEWLAGHAGEVDTYAGFNALLLDWSTGASAIDAWYLTNRHPNERLMRLEPGIHGLSNHLLGTRWPKVERLCLAMAEALADDQHVEAELLKALTDTDPVDREELSRADPDSVPEVLQRTPFIVDARYGTRASSVVMLRDDGLVRFIERSWSLHEGQPRQTQERVLQWPSYGCSRN